ncbi:hypothetical protein EON65_50705 [archaeon]|nr:MAG: hypothetical protein EON65_50705 [archaeon]
MSSYDSDNVVVSSSQQQIDDDFSESPASNGEKILTYSTRTSNFDNPILFVSSNYPGEIVMMLARGVGILVAIVAVLMWFMIMMIVRACLAWLVHIWGVSGIVLLVTIFVLGAMKYSQMSGKLIWVMFRHSCS